jgi:hypothetical protein
MVTLGSAVLMTLALVGCGGEGDSDLPEFSGAPGGQSEGESEAPEPAGTPVVDPASPLPKRGTEVGDPKNAITIGRTITGDADKEAVQTAYLAFWAERAKSLRLAEADTTAVRAVASGVAADRILASARELAEKKQHTEGGSTVNIQSVEITGSTAKITDCFKDDSINLTAAGKPAERPNLGIDQLAAELVKEGTTWRVTNLVQTTLKKCKA